MDVSCLNLVRGGEGWSIEEREGRGRCLVAKMQLEVGDVVFEEVPAVWGPKQHSPLCCLGCCKPLFMADICFCQVFLFVFCRNASNADEYIGDFSPSRKKCTRCPLLSLLTLIVLIIQKGEGIR